MKNIMVMDSRTPRQTRVQKKSLVRTRRNRQRALSAVSTGPASGVQLRVGPSGIRLSFLVPTSDFGFAVPGFGARRWFR